MAPVTPRIVYVIGVPNAKFKQVDWLLEPTAEVSVTDAAFRTVMKFSLFSVSLVTPFVTVKITA